MVRHEPRSPLSISVYVYIIIYIERDRERVGWGGWYGRQGWSTIGQCLSLNNGSFDVAVGGGGWIWCESPQV